MNLSQLPNLFAPTPLHDHCFSSPFLSSQLISSPIDVSPTGRIAATATPSVVIVEGAARALRHARVTPPLAWVAHGLGIPAQRIVRAVAIAHGFALALIILALGIPGPDVAPVDARRGLVRADGLCRGAGPSTRHGGDLFSVAVGVCGHGCQLLSTGAHSST